MAEKKDEISDLLVRLQKAGAEVRIQGKTGSALSEKVLNDLKEKEDINFTAWVSWSKGF